jgi:spore maturation protein A
MLNHIWFWIIIISLIVAAVNDTLDIFGSKTPGTEEITHSQNEEAPVQTSHLGKVTKGAIDAAELAVKISIGLIGVMALWLGIMRIAEEAGMIKKLGFLVRPLTKRLFPSIPQDHPAIGAMIMNIAANMLGLSNAATPLGLKAMDELQKLNKDKETASNDMIMFLVINTSAITLIPASAIAIRATLGSANPQQIIFPSIMAATCATVVGITTVKILQYFQTKRKNISPGGE